MMLRALCFVSAIGLPIIGIAASWLTCFRKDLSHLRFYRRLTAWGWIVLTFLLTLGSINTYGVYRGQVTEGKRAERVAQELRTTRAQLTSLRSETLKAFANDLHARVWYGLTAARIRAAYLDQRTKVFELEAKVQMLRSMREARETWKFKGEMPPEWRQYQIDYYAGLQETTTWLPEGVRAYLLLLRQAGIDESVLREASDKASTVSTSIPDLALDVERLIGKVGWDPAWAEGTVNQIRDVLDHLHESALIIVEAEYSRRLNEIAAPQ